MIPIQRDWGTGPTKFQQPTIHGKGANSSRWFSSPRR